MSSSITAPAPAATSAHSAVTTVNYTICPIYVASHVALELGWLEEEIKKAGGSLRYLRSFPDNGHQPHFSHKLDNLFRDGGNIPSIWAKADNTDTTLLGLTWFGGGGQILVRADSGIRNVASLRGRKIGLSRSLNTGKVDWWRATSERGIQLALALAGLDSAAVQITDIPHDDRHFTTAEASLPQKPAEGWARFRAQGVLGFVPEVHALAEGRVDAVYTNYGRAIALQRTGPFTVIEDLARHPDWTLQVANSPWALTVNTEFAREHPALVTAFVRASVRAGRWINANRDAAAAILQRVTYPPTVADAAQVIHNIDFVPSLSPRNLAAIEVEKNFLLSHGYIKRDFDVQAWATPRFLEEAIHSL
jgi:ABC-type nitrate/sulfonate/bicarbonate transport system substrate-binding protein